jgi:predicted 3-demethylubiquinone-9 3-methyltransferase (glyoxalase superfamily)
MFTGKVCGKAKEAMRFYAEVFGKTKPPDIHLCAKS